jgi:hypothetical protein
MITDSPQSVRQAEFVTYILAIINSVVSLALSVGFRCYRGGGGGPHDRLELTSAAFILLLTKFWLRLRIHSKI